MKLEKTHIMKIYIVFKETRDYKNILECFSTKEAATEFMAECEDDERLLWAKGSILHMADFYILNYTLDDQHNDN